MIIKYLVYKIYRDHMAVMEIDTSNLILKNNSTCMSCIYSYCFSVLYIFQFLIRKFQDQVFLDIILSKKYFINDRI